MVDDAATLRTAPAAGRSFPHRRADVGALLSYAVLALLVMARLWRDPNGRVLSANDDDHGVFQFMLAHGERVLFHGDHPFFTDRINVPDGVNMMANTSVLTLSLPVAPVTHFLGPGVSVALLLEVDQTVRPTLPAEPAARPLIPRITDRGADLCRVREGDRPPAAG